MVDGSGNGCLKTVAIPFSDDPKFHPLCAFVSSCEPSPHLLSFTQRHKGTKWMGYELFADFCKFTDGAVIGHIQSRKADLV